MNNSYSLTTPQQNIYNETKFYTGTALGNIGGTIELQMEGLTSEIIEKAINLLIDAAEGLSLHITEDGGEVFQCRSAKTQNANSKIRGNILVGNDFL